MTDIFLAAVNTIWLAALLGFTCGLLLVFFGKSRS